jgi:hypothetical protein
MPLSPPHSPEIPPELAEDLPPGILEMLETYRGRLWRNGIVETRTDRRRCASYRLRFRAPDEDGRVVQKSISLGHDPAVAHRVGQILTFWRSQRQEIRRRNQEEVEERRRERAERRRLKALIDLSAGGGRRHRRRIRAHVDDLVNSNDPIAGLRVLAEMEKGWTSPPPRGRPRRGRQLW